MTALPLFRHNEICNADTIGMTASTAHMTLSMHDHNVRLSGMLCGSTAMMTSIVMLALKVSVVLTFTVK